MAKKHIFIWAYYVLCIAIVLISVSFVRSEQSTDRTAYYYNGTYYMADGVENADIALNGIAAVNNTQATDYGWQDVGWGDTGTYTDFKSAKGSLSIKMMNSGSDKIMAVNIMNTTFKGTIIAQLWFDGSQTQNVFFNILSGTTSAGMQLWDSYNNYWMRRDTNDNFPIGCNINTITKDSTDNRWIELMFAWNGTTNTVNTYIDGILCTTFGYGLDFAGINQLRLGNSGGKGNVWWDVISVSNGAVPLENATPPAIPVSINFVSQAPADINSTNIFTNRLNITYNITNAANPSTIRLEYQTNNSGGVYQQYINNVGFNYPSNISYSSNLSNLDLFSLSDNQVYPASYNYNQSVIVSAAKSDSLVANSNTLKNRHYNIQNKQYSFLELYATAVGANNLDVYICNSSYSSGDVAVSPDCANFYTLSASASFDHCHGVSSCHFVIPMPIVDNKIDGIGITNPSYIVYHSLTSGWNLKYAAAYDSGSIETSATNGLIYSSLAGTLDSHIHFFSNADAFSYRACADSSCSAWNSDLMQLSGLPPSSPTIIQPNGGYKKGIIPINYTAAISPNGYSITAYLIEVYNSAYVFANTLVSNNYPALSYNWDSDQVFLSAANLSSSAASFYKFEEGAGAFAYPTIGSTTLNHSGAYSYVSSKGGNVTNSYAINYGGINGYSKASSRDSLRLYNDSTIAFWIKPNITSANGAFAGKSEGSTVEYWVGTSGVNPYFSYRTHQNTSQAFASTQILQNNTWQFLALTIKRNSPTSFNYTFYLNDNSQFSSAGSTGLLSQGAGDFNLGRIASSYYTRVSLDNILILNHTLSTTEIKQIYNWSIYNPSYVADGDYSIKVSATDLNGFSSFDFSEMFTLDNTVPSISINKPNLTYNETYNDTIYIEFTASEPVSCSLNSTSMALNYTNLSYYLYKENINMTAGFKAIRIACSDYALNTVSQDVYFTKDITYPAIFIYSPVNNSEYSSTKTKLLLNTSFLDERDLYDYAINISYYDEELFERINIYSESGIITGLKYANLTKLINFSNFINNTLYTMDVKTCDSHTSSAIKEASSVKKDKNALTYQFGDKQIKISSNSGSEVSADTKKEKDRYTFNFQYSKAEKKVFYLETAEKIVYLPNSVYKGHFVIGDRYWLDFEDSKVLKSNIMVTKENENKYSIYIDNMDTSLNFNSIGELNCVYEQISFSKVSPAPPYNPLGLGISFSNTGTILLFFALVILYLGCFLIGLFFKNFGFISFGFIIGLVLSLMLGALDIWLFIAFALLNVVIFIGTAKFKG